MVQQQLQEFEDRFIGEGCWTRLCDEALRGDPKTAGSKLRSVLWKVSAGLLPMYTDFETGAEQWIQVTEQLRDQYDKLKTELIVNPYETESVGDPLAANPLATSTVGDHSNPWIEYHQDREILDEIKKDLDRLYPSGCEDFFIQPALSKILSNVIFVWCKLHSELSYRQGMHELVAPVLYVLYFESIPARKKGTATQGVGDNPKRQLVDRLLKTLLDMTYLEHDVFWIFERIMRDMKQLFIISKSQMTQKEIERAKKEMVKQRKLQGASMAMSMPETTRTPVLALCEKIQYELLPEHDSYLASHLKSLGIEPQLYGMRWTRLLFGREFDMDELLILWDSLLVDGFQLRTRIPALNQTVSWDVITQVVSKCREYGSSMEEDQLRGVPLSAAYVAVAMLTRNRNALLDDDYNYVLTNLMKFPRVSDVGSVVQQAMAIQTGTEALQSSVQPVLARPTPIKTSISPLRDRMAFRGSSSEDTQATSPLVGASKILTATIPEEIGSNVSSFFKGIGGSIDTYLDQNGQNAIKPSIAPVAPSGPGLSPKRQQKSPVSAASTVLDDVNYRMGNRLDRVIKRIQSVLEDSQVMNEGGDDIAALLAEMKQIRDVLLRRLEESECFPPGDIDGF